MIPTGVLRIHGHLDGGVTVSREKVTMEATTHLS